MTRSEANREAAGRRVMRTLLYVRHKHGPTCAEIDHRGANVGQTSVCPQFDSTLYYNRHSLLARSKPPARQQATRELKRAGGPGGETTSWRERNR